MRVDRYGEPLEEADAEDGHRCRRGWLDRSDVVRPCPHCRPWLAERPARPPTRDELDAWRARLARAS